MPEYLYMTNSKNKFKAAMSSTNKAVLSVAKSILDEAGINFTLANTNGYSDIMVLEDDLFKARNLLHELEELDFESND